MRLLRAELTKLRRPLTWWVAAAAVAGQPGLRLAGGRRTPPRQHRPAPAAVPARRPAATSALPPGPLCNQAVAVQEQIDAYRQQQAADQARRPATTPVPATPCRSSTPSAPANWRSGSWPRCPARC